MVNWKWIEDDSAPQGCRAAGVRSGIKTTGPDLVVIAVDGEEPASAAVFTRSQFSAPPVLLSRRHSASGSLRAIVANSGCANACTGEQGLADAQEMADLTARELGIQPGQILVASTGIIGHPLPMDKIRTGIPEAVNSLATRGFRDAARAILTTDTVPKQAAISVEIGGHPVILQGMVKGSGMVAPDMATVFAFFATDARIEKDLLQASFQRVMNVSINRVTVDSDASTNDTACILASGAAANNLIGKGSPEAEAFENALTLLAQRLARKLARDGEGASHLVTVHVTGAREESEAHLIANSIANSPLVKTAIFGKDPNWGRIAMAAGKAGVPFDQRQVDIHLNNICVMDAGIRVDFDSAQMSASMQEDEISIRVDLHSGAAESIVWTCDFSYEYVKINAEYHT